MTQPHDPVRLIGRNVLLVENGTTTSAHVIAAGAGGITLQIGEGRRFLRPEEVSGLELDADGDHVADAAR